MDNDRQTLFISYCWKDGDAYADDLEVGLKETFDVYRDKTSLDVNDDIFEFMSKIAQCDNIVIVLTEQYLYSRNCMYELCTLADQDGWGYKSICLIIYSDFYNSDTRSEIAEYWAKDKRRLYDKYNMLDSGKDSIKDDLKQVDVICKNISRVLRNLSRRNNPSQILAIHHIVRFAEKYKAKKKNMRNVQQIISAYGSMPTNINIDNKTDIDRLIKECGNKSIDC